MTSAFHGNQTILQGLHSIVAFSYPSIIERSAAIDFNVYDVYKLAIDLDDNTFWIIIDVDGYGNATWQNLIGSSGGAVGGDLSGALPNPTVVDLHISGQTQGSVIYYNGSHWVNLNPGNDGYVLTTQGAGENPIWSPVITDLNVANQSKGDLLYFDGSNWVVLGAGSDGYILTAKGVGQDPIWYPPVLQGPTAINAGTQFGSIGTISFINSNGISFGMSNSNQITASYTTPSLVGLLSNVNISAGSTSNNLSALTFSNSNGLSFGLNGSVITGSYTVPNVPVQTAFIFSNSNGLSFGTNISTVTGSYTVPSTIGLISAINVSGGTTSNNLSALVFSNSNNVSFGLNGSTITASIPAQSNQTLNIVVPSAGTQTATSGTVSFINSNGISFGMSGSNQITASYTVPNTAGLISNINISAGTTSNNLTALTFSNSNGLSFGLNGSTITGSYTVPVQSNQTEGMYVLGNTVGQSSSSTFDARTMSISAAGNISAGYSGNALIISGSQSNQTLNIVVPSAGTQTATSGTVVFANSNGFTFGMSGSSQITGSYTVPSIVGLISAINISAGTTSNNISALTFSNSNGLSFGLNGSTITASYTVPTQTVQSIGIYGVGNTTGQSSSSTFDARSLSFQGGGIVSVGNSNGSIIISAVAAGAGDGGNILAAGTQTAISNASVLFSNSNGISFGMSNSSIITASYTVPTQTNQTLGLYALGNTVGQSSSSTFDARTISISGKGAVSVGYSGNNIIISAPTKKVSQLLWPETPWQTNFPISNASFSLQHFNPKLDIVVSQANLLMALSGNTNSSGALSISLGIYTMSGSTMSLASSDSRQLTWTSGSQTSASSLFGGVSGTRYRTVGLNNWSISAGDYMLAMWFRTTNNGTWNAFGIQGPTIVGAVDINETNQYLHGFSTSSYSTAMIASINVTDTNYVRTGGNALQQPGIVLLGTY